MKFKTPSPVIPTVFYGFANTSYIIYEKINKLLKEAINIINTSEEGDKSDMENKRYTVLNMTDEKITEITDILGIEAISAINRVIDILDFRNVDIKFSGNTMLIKELSRIKDSINVITENVASERYNLLTIEEENVEKKQDVFYYKISVYYPESGKTKMYHIRSTQNINNDKFNHRDYGGFFDQFIISGIMSQSDVDHISEYNQISEMEYLAGLNKGTTIYDCKHIPDGYEVSEDNMLFSLTKDQIMDIIRKSIKEGLYLMHDPEHPVWSMKEIIDKCNADNKIFDELFLDKGDS